MSPAELHAWLVARWQEKLDTARAAGGETWLYSGRALEINGEGDFAVFAKGGSREHAVARLSDWNRTLHVVTFDPAFAIAVCEAALRRLARHEPQGNVIVVCRWCTDEEADVPWPCPEVLDDAAPFADRDDFPEELRR